MCLLPVFVEEENDPVTVPDTESDEDEQIRQALLLSLQPDSSSQIRDLPGLCYKIMNASKSS